MATTDLRKNLSELLNKKLELLEKIDRYSGMGSNEYTTAKDECRKVSN